MCSICTRICFVNSLTKIFSDLPCSPAKFPFCFSLLFLCCLPPFCVLNGPFYFLRAERSLDPLKVGGCPPQGLVLHLHLLQAFGQVGVSLPYPAIVPLQTLIALEEYLDSARNGTLNVDILNTFICSIEAIERENSKKSINLNISAAQFGDLINCIFDYTMRLAEANNVSTKSINRPKYFHKKTSDDLKYYLNMQKQIFEQAA